MKPTLSPDVRALIQRAYASNPALSIRQLAHLYQVSPASIQQLLEKSPLPAATRRNREKLTLAQELSLVEMRRRATQAACAAAFGVHPVTVWRIVCRHRPG